MGRKGGQEGGHKLGFELEPLRRGQRYGPPPRLWVFKGNIYEPFQGVFSVKSDNCPFSEFHQTRSSAQDLTLGSTKMIVEARITLTIPPSNPAVPSAALNWRFPTHFIRSSAQRNEDTSPQMVICLRSWTCQTLEVLYQHGS